MTNPLNDIADAARMLATFAPESGRNLRRELDDVASCRDSLADRPDNEAWKRLNATAHHNVNCYRANCNEAHAKLNTLAKLVYQHLPEVDLKYCRINPTWRFDDVETDWPAIVAELRRIEDAALRKLLATTDDPENEANEPQPAAILESLNDDAMMNHRDLATVLNVKAEPLRKRLDRWRQKNGDGWQELTEATSKEPRYLYRVGVVRDVLREAIKAK